MERILYICVLFTITAVVCTETDIRQCGSGLCINNTLCCPGEKECCTDLGLCCGEHCCHQGYECCHGSPRCCKSASSCCGDSLCCPENTKCCPNKKHCCPEGYTCCDSSNGCCPERSHCCGKYCCAENMMCCPNGTGCYSKGFHCCGNGLACRDGVECCGEECCSEGYKCCGSHCCHGNTECCGDSCCAATTRNPSKWPTTTIFVQIMTSQSPSETFTEKHENLRTTKSTNPESHDARLADWAYILPVIGLGVVIAVIVAAFLLFRVSCKQDQTMMVERSVGDKVSAYVHKIKTLMGRQSHKPTQAEQDVSVTPRF